MKLTRFAMTVSLVAGAATPELPAQTVDRHRPDDMAEQLERMLESGNAEARMAAIQQLARSASPYIRNACRQCIPILIRTSASGDRKHAVAATEALTSFGPSPWAVLDFLAGNGTPLARSMFGRTLPMEVRAAVARMDRGWPGALVASRLLPCLHDNKAEVRHCAISCLGMLGDDGKPAVPVLVRVLRRGPVADRWRAAWALGMIGNRSKSVVAALTKARVPTKPWAGVALARLKFVRAPREALRKALVTLRQLLPAERSGALRLGHTRRSKLPDLIVPLLKAEGWSQREAAAMVLKALHRR